MTVERTDDPTRATQGERYGEGVADRTVEMTFYQRLALVLSQVFHPVYRALFAGRGHFLSRLELRLAQAKVSTPVEIYLSNAVALGTLSGALVGTAAGVTGLAVFGMPGASVGPEGALGIAGSGLVFALAAGVWLALFGASGLLAGLGAAVYYPSVHIYQRRREIDLVMPDVVGFMYSLSVGGTDILDVFGAVAESEDTYGEAAVEFQQLTHEIAYFSVDYQTAVERVARTTPSDELSKFLLDLLSVVNSGGDVTDFLETEKNHQMDKRRRTQEDLLNTLEVFGEVYISLTVLPLILVVVLVIMALLGDAQLFLLLVTVYVVLPALNAMYLVAVSMTVQDDVGTGRLDDDQTTPVGRERSVGNPDIVETHLRANPGEQLLHRIRTEALRYRVSQVLSNPLAVFRSRPAYTLAATVPLSGLVLVLLLAQGVAEPSRQAIEQRSLEQTFVWFGIPLFLTVGPLGLAYEWRARTVAGVTDTLTADLRKLANANATGQPLMEAIRIAGEDNNTRLGRELTTLYKRVSFGGSLGTALVEFANRYRVPRLARSVKLVRKAQETSDQITDVLTTAADLSEIQDDLEREKRTRTRMQVLIIGISFVVFVAVLLMLEEFFIETIVEVTGENPDAEFADFEAVEPAFLSMLYLHAALLQGACAGVICGYIQTGRVAAGLKYALGFVGFAFLAWAAAGLLV